MSSSDWIWLYLVCFCSGMNQIDLFVCLRSVHCSCFDTRIHFPSTWARGWFEFSATFNELADFIIIILKSHTSSFIPSGSTLISLYLFKASFVYLLANQQRHSIQWMHWNQKRAILVTRLSTSDALGGMASSDRPKLRNWPALEQSTPSET